MPYINRKAAGLRQGAIRAMFDRASAMQDVISMGIGEPDMATPAVVCAAGDEALKKGYTHYSANAGLMLLREAIAEKSTVSSLHYDPKREIIVTNGGMGGLSLLFLVLLDEGDEVLVQDPQWLNYVAQIEYCGGRAVRVPTSGAHCFEMQPEVIESRIGDATKALMINSPNNPTGEVMGEKAMERIAELAIRHDLIVISDEVYNTLLYTGRPYRSIAELPGMRERTVVVNSFSKSYAMTGWRIGYVAAPEEIVDKMTKCQENFNACANVPGQYAAAKALEHPEICRELCAIFAERRETLLRGMKSIPGMIAGKSEGAFYAFPDIRAFGLDSAAFCNRLLEEAGVVCIPGSAFGQCGEGYIRICYTCGDAALAEAISRIRGFCARLRGA